MSTAHPLARLPVPSQDSIILSSATCISPKCSSFNPQDQGVSIGLVASGPNSLALPLGFYVGS